MSVTIVCAATGCTAAAKPTAGASCRRRTQEQASRSDRSMSIERRRWERHSRKVRVASARGAAATIAGMQRSSTARDTESRWPGQLAAIDMGSNSFRLEIGQLARRPLPPHRLPEGDGAPRRRARRRRLPRRRGGRARPRLPGPLRAPPRRLRAAARCARSRRRRCARRSNRDAFLAARARRPRPADRDHLGPRGSAPHLSPASRGCSRRRCRAWSSTSAAARPR